MELISMAQKGRPLTREEHEKAKEAGIPMPFMEGMAQITEDLSAMPAPNKASYTPQGFIALPPFGLSQQRFLYSDPDGDDNKGMAEDAEEAQGRSWSDLHLCPRRSEQNLLRKGRLVPDARVHSRSTCRTVLKIRPLEEMFKFGNFFSPLLHASDFEAKPSILLLGQYSTGLLFLISLDRAETIR